jgi:excisionase family DNA binding protein
MRTIAVQNTETPEPMAYSIEDTCRLLSVSRSTVYALLRTGKLRSVKLAQKRLIVADSIRELLAAA